ncbi:amino acid adenylation domain-containing protein [Nocardiopsis sp. NPDC049922]|uniref:amino acid adenylation domain-containing protein n=1 Tax=Nocardiopsis sp. NPDC049922 TaxID=3155157 RepID=UPI0033FF9110
MTISNADRAAGLSDRKQELLRQRLRGAAHAGRPPGIPRRAAEPAPLSPVQHGMWVTQQFLEDTALYNVPRVLRISGPLDVTALRDALDTLVRRHEILRTTYPDPARPLQTVSPPGPVALRREDVSHRPPDRRWAEAIRHASAEIASPFDLAEGPVFRALLITVESGPEDPLHVLVLNTHHIATDDWSSSLLLRELDEAYGALAEGREPRLRPLPVQYGDYSSWQHERMTGKRSERQLAWWRETLAATPRVLELPTDLPRPTTPSHRGAAVRRVLGPGLADRVRAVAAAHGVTLYTALLSAFSLVLGHYSGQTRFAVGSLLSGRNAAETESLAGLFVNAVALPADLTGAPPFSEVLSRTHSTIMGAFDHQDVTFEQVVADLGVDRTESRNPVYQVLYQCLESSERLHRLPGLNAEPVALGEETAKVDLTLTAVNGADHIELNLNYATDLFQAATAERLLGHLENVLERAVRDPDRKITRKAVLGPAEWRTVTRDRARDTDRYPDADRYPLDETVVGLFRAQAAATPSAHAISTGTETLTYAGLDELTDRIARSLRLRGVGPGDAVGVSLLRGVGMVATVIGILKAGAAYVALDPAYPAARLRLMMSDAGVRFVVAEGPTAAAAMPDAPDAPGEAPSPLRYAELAAPPDDRERPLTDRRPVPPASADVAYIMYTSGSTGRPKGVVITHHGLTNLLLGARDLLHSGPADRWLLLTSLSFDPSVIELFLPLITGGRVVVAPDEARLDGAVQRRLIKEHGVTHVQTTPSGWRLLLSDDRDIALSAAITVGEVLTPQLARRIQARARRLVNAYGPTEVTVYASYADVPADPDTVTVGRPAANVRVYLLDDELEPVPHGATGEICVGGEGIAHGYRDLPGLSARRFVPDPFGPPGSRLYRTGDRGRYRRDGEIELHGRVDDQVKIRGHRVEPGEVETVLQAHPAVREAAVVASPGPSGVLRLIGYVVPSPPEGEDTPTAGRTEDEVRRYLEAVLPAYMVPGVFVPCDGLPLTPSGKVDRKALPEAGEASSGATFVPPRTEAERVLADVWATVLGRETVSAGDNFFAIGGDSVLAIHVAVNARKAGLELSPRQILTRQTLAELAAAARPADDRERSAAVPSTPVIPQGLDLDPERTEDVYPLTPMQAGMLYHTLREPTEYVRYLVCDLPGDLDTEAFRRSWDGVLARHTALRTRFTWEHTPEPLQIVERPSRAVFHRLDWRGLDAEERDRRFTALMDAERRRPFDLAAGPPLRFTLIREDIRYRLLLSLHHIVFDAWSLNLVMDEVFTRYASLSEGKEPPELPVPVPFRAYADRVRGRSPDGEYWRELLRGFGAPTDLRMSPPRGASRGLGVRRWELPEDLVEGVRALARRCRVTVGAVLHAAWGLLLSRYAGATDVVFGSTAAGRSDGMPGAERAVGLLMNTLPVRLRTPGGLPVATWLRQVHTQLAELREHEHASLVEVQRQSDVPASERLFDTILVFTNNEHRPAGPRPAALSMAGEGEASGTGYPLVLSVVQRDGLALELEHRLDYCAPDAARRMGDHVEAVLRNLCREDAVLADVEPLPESERQLVTEEFNTTDADYPKTSTVHGLFEEQVRRDPEATAIVDHGGRRVSYRELNARANRLAHHLRGLGVGAESLVGVCLEHSVELFVALFGILKAGGAYVPLDTEHPPERLALILQDTGAAVTVTAGRGADALPPSYPGRVVGLDDESVFASCPVTDPEPLTDAHSLLYVIYTSGSTGVPKGVLVPHQGVVNYLWWAVSGYGLEGASGAPMLGSIAYDLSVPNFFLPLIGGKDVTLLDRDRPLEALSDLLREPGDYSLLKITPGHLDVLRGVLGEKSVDSVRTFVVGADEVRADTVAGWREVAPRSRIIDEYGPTETVVGCSTYVVPDDFDPSVPVSIGVPIANIRMYALDERLRPVPIGVPGELYIGGDGVVRGYLNRPGLTARRFLPDPFSPVPGSRFYRTGDLVRFRPDGNLEFLGRNDHQVKIRGYRVELGEVETRLLSHPDVVEAVASAWRDPNGHKRLVAHLVTADGRPSPTPAELNEHMRRTLPDPMVPTTYTVLDAMPLNPAGKVDRSALPRPGSSKADGAEAPEQQPRNESERLLARVWAEVLGLDEVGVHQDFLDLGGDSILSIRMMAAARRVGLSLTPRDVFAARTVAELASAVGEGAPQAPLHAEQDTVTGEVPLTPMGRWFTALDWPHAHYNQSVRLRWDRPVDADALRWALEAMVEHHDALRLRLDRLPGGAWRQHIAPVEAAGPLCVLDLSGVADREEAVRRAADELHRGLDLRHGPLLRALLITHGPDAPDELLISVHHLAVDTVSWSVLLDDLADAYRQCLDGEPPTLLPKTTSFQHWARRLSEYAVGSDFHAEATYWRERRGPSGPFPVDHPGGDDTQGSTAVVGRALEPGATEALLRTAHDAYGTRIDDLLITALAQALGPYTGGTVHVDLESHGREPLFDDVDLSRTVGWFTAVRPLRIRLPQLSDPGRSVRAVRELLRAVPHRGIGYGLARYLGPEPFSDGRAPVSFNYQGQDGPREAGGLFTRLGPAPGAARSPHGRRPYLIDVNCAVVDGALRTEWAYSTGLHRKATVEGLADRFIGRLRALLEHCAAVASERDRSQSDRRTDRLIPGAPFVALHRHRHRVPGAAVALIDGGRVCAEWGDGIADRSSDLPVRADTVFQAGSASKHVTTVAALRLAQDGVLDLDEDVNAYLRTWRVPVLDPGRPVTARHLLSHTAGLCEDEFGGRGAVLRGGGVPTALDVLMGRPPAATPPVRAESVPGERFRYSGHHFVAMERVLRDLTGVPFPELMRELVFDPLEMRDAGYGDAFLHGRDGGTAVGHGNDGLPVEGGWRVYPAGSGGLWASAGDMARLSAEVVRAHTGGGLVLDRRSSREMLTRVPGAAYGLGTVIRPSADGVWIGHPGDAVGFRCYAAASLETGTGLVVMANGEGGAEFTLDLLAHVGLEMNVLVSRG